ncbi:MAG: hypothetical protein A2X58_08030 [Nitrospirae bacterium GWC2_56_14]|nr:MAG: hypothetical protein A2X58_08030 [Nitrospirae bacterium GWC2_56_14]
MRGVGYHVRLYQDRFPLYPDLPQSTDECHSFPYHFVRIGTPNDRDKSFAIFRKWIRIPGNGALLFGRGKKKLYDRPPLEKHDKQKQRAEKGKDAAS